MPLRHIALQPLHHPLQHLGCDLVREEGNDVGGDVGALLDRGVDRGEVAAHVGALVEEGFDAIEVPFVDAIPSDFDGMMGVPITFLDRYNPDQFEIVGSSEGDYPQSKVYKGKQKVVDGVPTKSHTGSYACYVRVDEFGPGTYFDVGYPVKRIYKRLFIRRKVNR